MILYVSTPMNILAFRRLGASLYLSQSPISLHSMQFCEVQMSTSFVGASEVVKI